MKDNYFAVGACRARKVEAQLFQVRGKFRAFNGGESAEFSAGDQLKGEHSLIIRAPLY
jgi:hypothetical protein